MGKNWSSREDRLLLHLAEKKRNRTKKGYVRVQKIAKHFSNRTYCSIHARLNALKVKGAYVSVAQRAVSKSVESNPVQALITKLESCIADVRKLDKQIEKFDKLSKLIREV